MNGIFVLLALACGLTIIVFSAAREIRRLTRRGGAGAFSDVMTCGSCGYDVAGLETFVCPECGKDLRRVGIVAAGEPVRSKPKASLSSRIVLLSIVCIVCSPIWIAAGERFGGQTGQYIAGVATFAVWLAGIIFEYKKEGRSAAP